jgi:hypothetical protein
VISHKRFAIQNVLPGVYSVEIPMFGYSLVNHDITMGVEDIDVGLTNIKLH